MKVWLRKYKLFFRILPYRMKELAKDIVNLMPLEANRLKSYYDLGVDGQARGLLHDVYKCLSKCSNE